MKFNMVVARGMPMADRIAGHADARMTLSYDITDIERRRRVPSEILARLGFSGDKEPGVVQ
jgi:hypothetical protein